MEKKSWKKICGIWFMVLAVAAALIMGAAPDAQAKQKKAKKLTLNVKSMSMQTGDRIYLKVTQVTPASASKKVTWRSSNKKVAVVNKSGQIRAKKKGTATISARAKNGKAVAKCRIKVNKKKTTDSKVLVAYFSATNTTKAVAEKIAKASGGRLYRITPAKKYTAKDLNYDNDSCRATREQHNKKARPAMKGTCAGLQKYDVVYVGFPIWWGDALRIMSNFMESYNFSGKTVIPFCTSGGSGIKKAVKTLKAVTRGKASWRSGKRFDGDVSQADITKWVSSQSDILPPADTVPTPTPGITPTAVPTKPAESVPTPTPTQPAVPAPTSAAVPTQTPDIANPPESSEPPEGRNKILVAYFSCTGSTKGIAEKIAAAAGADLHEITPEVPYTSADLNYNDGSSRANMEQNDSSARPGILGSVEDIDQYETIFLGYPIWHGKAPRIMDTFVESYDFSGKTVIPFCTSASSGIGGSADELQELSSENATWISGRRFSGGDTEAVVAGWVQELGMTKDTEGQEGNRMMNIQVGTVTFKAELADNSSAEALAEKLAEGPITIQMNDYASFEKVGPLGFDLPTNNEQITTEPGDLILYQGNQFVLYYGTNSWNFTRLGKIQNTTAEELKEVLGGGNVTAILTLADAG